MQRYSRSRTQSTVAEVPSAATHTALTGVAAAAAASATRGSASGRIARAATPGSEAEYARIPGAPASSLAAPLAAPPRADCAPAGGERGALWSLAALQHSWPRKRWGKMSVRVGSSVSIVKSETRPSARPTAIAAAE